MVLPRDSLSSSAILPSPTATIATLSLLALMPITASAVVSNIEQVTIYQGMASVTRSLSIDSNHSQRNGEQIVVFSCLSPLIDVDSISIQAPSSVNIGEVSIEQLNGEQAQQCQYQGDAEVRKYQGILNNINAQLEAAQLAKSYLNNLAQVTQISIDGNIAEGANDIEQQATQVNKRLIELRQQQAQAQDDLNQLIANAKGSTYDAVTQVSIRTASLHGGEVKIHYQVRGAGWQPTYQARLDTDSEQLSLTAYALIAQQTGENWLNIPLTLSTVNPNQKTGSLLPYNSDVYLYDNDQSSRMSRSESLSPAPALVVMPDTSVHYEVSAGSTSSPPLPSFNVNNSHKNGIIEYQLSQRVSIPSDGRHIRTVIDQQTGTSQLWLRSTPSRETKAYWYASAPFITPAWAEGSMQLYRDNNYIGQSNYSYQTLKDQGIGFGVDPDIIITQLTDEDTRGDSGVFNRTKQLHVTESYQLTNQHDRRVRLEVLGSEPISKDDDLKVEVVHTPPVTVTDWNNNQGMVAWQFDLAAQQSQTVSSSYTLSYPADKELR